MEGRRDGTRTALALQPQRQQCGLGVQIQADRSEPDAAAQLLDETTARTGALISQETNLPLNGWHGLDSTFNFHL